MINDDLKKKTHDTYCKSAYKENISMVINSH